MLDAFTEAAADRTVGREAVLEGDNARIIAGMLTAWSDISEAITGISSDERRFIRVTDTAKYIIVNMSRDLEVSIPR